MSTAPARDDDGFLGRLRRSADSAVPPSTLDLDDVLRASRRGARRHRTLAVAASALAVVTVGAGVATAGGPAALHDLAREVVAGAPAYEVLTDDPMVADLGSGAVAVLEPATYLRDDGTLVLDLGLGAWRPGERFLVEYEPSESEAPGLRVVAGGDDDLSALLRGETAGTVVHDGYTPLVLVRQEGGSETLVLDVEPSVTPVAAGPGHERERRETWLVLTDDAPGSLGSTVALPGARAGGLLVRAAILGRDGVPMPDVRGVLDAVSSEDGTSVGTVTCESPLVAADAVPGCRSAYDPTTRSVRPVDPPAAVLDRTVVDLLLGLEHDGAPYDDGELQRECLAARNAEPATVPDDVRQLSPAGVDGDAWRQCLLDTSLVRSAWTLEAVSSVQQGS